MCGLAGLFLPGGAPLERLQALLPAMRDTLRHRGPDDAGAWYDADAGLALGHRRLSIVDLSPGGHQPMVSADGRWVIAFNGEIYNHRELRAELERAGVGFRSSSDTEVMLEGFARWGVPATLQRLAGMFALALWDRQRRELVLARDRMGKKPLYVAAVPGGFAFASELKALQRVPGYDRRLSDAALQGFFRYGYVADDLCIHAATWKPMPGEWVQAGADGVWRRAAYWSLEAAARAGAADRIDDPAAARAALLEVLRTATRQRMVADVPLGAFLSGGIDSALVVALMQEAAQRPTRTYSIGFEEATHDEAPVARAVARHLGTEHTELYVTRRDALDLVPRLPELFDEPFADASQVPTALLAALARPHVTVALTGDGGDEAFGGYVRYRSEGGLVGGLHRLPRPLRRGLAGALEWVPAAAWDQAAGLLPARRRPRFPAWKVAKLARVLRCDGAAERARLFLTLWDTAALLPGLPEARPEAALAAPADLDLAPSERMQFWETRHYLPGDLLAKMDRATMASSLEARAPLLDHRVVELAWRLPARCKAEGPSTKHILRELLFGYVPRALVDLPKQGFSAPVGPWLRTELRGLAEDTLAQGRRTLPDLLAWPVVDAAWRAHLAGRGGLTEPLWAVLMFVRWHERWQREGAAP